VNDQATLSVGGFTPFTTIDFPGRLAAVVFCQGCSWRCRYCHNPHLLPARRQQDSDHKWPLLRDWIKSRRGLLDGIVFSGGEPLLQRALAQAVIETRQLGFAVALHTAGAYPQRLGDVLPDLDWVGFDIKAPFEDYKRIADVDNGHEAEKSLIQILRSSVDYEVRCTVDINLLDERDMEKLARQLASLGVDHLVLQPRRDSMTSQRLPQEMIEAAGMHLARVELRGA